MRIDNMSWVRSTYCADRACVEVAADGNHVLVRDSKNPEHPPLTFRIAEWMMFIDAVAAGEFALAG